MARVRIHIDQRAKTEITVDGVCGPSCDGLVKPLAEHLGTIESKETTSDYYAEEVHEHEATATH